MSAFANNKKSITGIIIEISANKEFVQVGNSIYRVQNVMCDNGQDTLKNIARSFLKEGDLLLIYPGDKTDDYWETQQVVLLMDEKRQTILHDIGLKADAGIMQDVSTGQDITTKKVTHVRQIFLENGVWKNR